LIFILLENETIEKKLNLTSLIHFYIASFQTCQSHYNLLFILNFTNITNTPDKLTFGLYKLVPNINFFNNYIKKEKIKENKNKLIKLKKVEKVYHLITYRP